MEWTNTGQVALHDHSGFICAPACPISSIFKTVLEPTHEKLAGGQPSPQLTDPPIIGITAHLAIFTQILVPEGILLPASGFCSTASPLPTTFRSRPNFSHACAMRRTAHPEKSGTVTRGPSPKTTVLAAKPSAGSGSAAGRLEADGWGKDAGKTGDVAAPSDSRSEGRNPKNSSGFWTGSFMGFGVTVRGHWEGLS